MAREMIPHRSGRIINIASIAGKGFLGIPTPSMPPARGAVINLTKTAAQQLGHHDANVVRPGSVHHKHLPRYGGGDRTKKGVRSEEIERHFAEGVLRSGPMSPRTSPPRYYSWPPTEPTTSRVSPSTSTAPSLAKW